MVLRSEAEISWNRSNYFTVVESILLLALSQFHQLPVQGVVVIAGITVSVTWILAQDRSAQYLRYWKEEIEKLETRLGQSTVYPSKGVQGMEVRKVLYIVPITFLVLWIVLLVIAPLGWL